MCGMFFSKQFAQNLLFAWVLCRVPRERKKKHNQKHFRRKSCRRMQKGKQQMTLILFKHECASLKSGVSFCLLSLFMCFSISQGKSKKNCEKKEEELTKKLRWVRVLCDKQVTINLNNVNISINVGMTMTLMRTNINNDHTVASLE